MKCPACKATFGQNSTNCYACGREWSRATWLDIGVVMALSAFWAVVWLLSMGL